jgi:hypothetical protein
MLKILGGTIMKCYFLWTVTGPQLILTSCDYVKDPACLNKLKDMGIPKFVAHEVSIDLVKARYGESLVTILQDPDSTDELRVLDTEGKRFLNNISFKDLGPAIPYE